MRYTSPTSTPSVIDSIASVRANTSVEKTSSGRMTSRAAAAVASFTRDAGTRLAPDLDSKTNSSSSITERHIEPEASRRESTAENSAPRRSLASWPGGADPFVDAPYAATGDSTDPQTATSASASAARRLAHRPSPTIDLRPRSCRPLPIRRPFENSSIKLAVLWGERRNGVPRGSRTFPQ